MSKGVILKFRLVDIYGKIIVNQFVQTIVGDIKVDIYPMKMKLYMSILINGQTRPCTVENCQLRLKYSCNID